MAKRKPEVRQSRHDVTLRLYRALKKRVASLEREYKSLRARSNQLGAHVMGLRLREAVRNQKRK